MESTMSALMRAVVLETQEDALLVRDCHTRQNVLVHTDSAGEFRPCDCVCIHYSGAMTMSIPPQISADEIHCLRRG